MPLILAYLRRLREGLRALAPSLQELWHNRKP